MQEEGEKIGVKGKKRFRRSQDVKEKWMNDFNSERDKLLEELKQNDNDNNCKKFLEFLDCRREYLMVSSPNNPFGSNSTSIGDQIKLNEIQKLSNITNCYDSYKNNGTNAILKWEQKFQQGKRKEMSKFSRRNPKCESLYLWFISRKIDFYNIVKSMPLNYTQFWDYMKDEKLYEGGGQISDKIKRCVTSHFNTTEYNNIGNWMYTFGSEREIHNIKLKRGLINITEYDNWLNEKEKNFTNSQTWNVTDLKPFTDHWKSLRNETEEYRNNIISNHNCSLINDLNNDVITTHNPLFTTTNVSHIMNGSTVSIVNDTTESTTYTSVISIPLTNTTISFPTTPSKGISSTRISYSLPFNLSVQTQNTSHTNSSQHKNSASTSSSYVPTKLNALTSTASPTPSALTLTPTTTGKTNASTTIPSNTFTSGSVTIVGNSSITPITGTPFTSSGATITSVQSSNTMDYVGNLSISTNIDNLTTQNNMHTLSISVTPTTVGNLSSTNTSFPSSTIKTTKSTLTFTDSPSTLNNTDTTNNSSTSTASVFTTNTNNSSFQYTTASIGNSSSPSPSSAATLTTSFSLKINSSHRPKNNSNNTLISPVNFSSTGSINSFFVQSGTTNQNTSQFNVSDIMNTTSTTSIPNVPIIIPSHNVVHDKNPGNILIFLGIPFGTIIFGIYFFLLLYKCTPIGSWIGKRKSKKKKKIKKIGSKDASTSMYPKKKSVKKMKHLVPSYGMQLPSCEITFENEKNVEKKKKYKEIELEEVRNEFIVQAEEEKIEEKENEEEYIKDKEKKKVDVKLKELGYLNEEMIYHKDSNMKDKIPINREMHKKKIFIEIYMAVLDECQREEWELYKEDFLKICLEEWKNDNTLYEDIILEENKVKNTEQGISSISFEGQKFLWNKYMKNNKKMLEKWKRDKWFKNLKKEWEKEQRDCRQIANRLELMKMEEGKNTMVEKQKIIWKHWLIKQRKWFMECEKEKWFNE
ncbi:surface-associated interspersed protein (SURFIN), partial [Plasmodium relictum]